MSTKNFVDFADLKRRLSIEQAIPLIGLTLKGRGDQWRGACPKCRSAGDRAVVVTQSKQSFYCFGCKKGGDIIAMVAHYKDMGQREAAEVLDRHFGTVPAENSSTTVPKRTEGTGAKALAPLDYLQVDHEGVKALGVSKKTCEAFGSGYAPKGILRGRFAIPIHDRSGTLVAYCGRTVKNESPVLTFPNGFSPAEHIFNAHQVSAGELFLTRDPLDVLLAHQNGVENVVAFLTEGIAAQQLEQLASLMDQKDCETVSLF